MVTELFNGLKRDGFNGEMESDPVRRLAYATDASEYREIPLAIIYPSTNFDLKLVVVNCNRLGIPLTVRAAGTSLAGQVVTSGVVVDISRHLTGIIEINTKESWVSVEPGVILDELNRELRKHNLFFGPETSTSNRCTIGGMVGNNACGLHSILYGSTRDHLLEIKVLLSDGSEALLGDLDEGAFQKKLEADGLEGSIYRAVYKMLSSSENADAIREGFPDPAIGRRNSGYALDTLLDTRPFNAKAVKPFNMAKVIAGSEGTLAVVTEIKLGLIPLPPAHKLLICIHLRVRIDAFRANLIVLKHMPAAVEMMDNTIIELTRDNIEQQRNRFFIEGKPAAILIAELVDVSDEAIHSRANILIDDLKQAGYGYAFPIISGDNISRVWNLRRAGLGLLANMKGDERSVSVIEDSAVNVEQLPDYIDDIEAMLARYGKKSVYHAHIGSGELHIRPLLNIKDPADRVLFRRLAEESAHIIKKYRGSISGEHGDGRLRGEFLPIVLGKKNYDLLVEFKGIWDPMNILNPGKITATPPMDEYLRYDVGHSTRELKTYFDFTKEGGIIPALEKCNGSGDCRKTEMAGGTMCPSFMATRDEMLSTRARSNILREFLSREAADPWNHREVYDILDECLGCKGCKSECPSNMDISKLKSEFLQHWYDRHGIPLRTRLIANISSINRIGSTIPYIYNLVVASQLFRSLADRFLGFARERSFPRISQLSLRRWADSNLNEEEIDYPNGAVYFFVDEFTDYNDTAIGIKAIKLLNGLGYKVKLTPRAVSGRAYISKGLLKKASVIARKNVARFSLLQEGIKIVGIEPSAILTFRDEYPELVGKELKDKSVELGRRCLLIEEFIIQEYQAGRVSRDSFGSKKAEIIVHGHCQQKALVSSSAILEMLRIPFNHSATEIKSGCCGMAGSFGFEKEHYALSMKVGEMILFPEVRSANADVVIGAPGTSCRQHIKEGTGKTALHPVEILYNALMEKRDV